MANQRVNYQTAVDSEAPGDLDSGYTNNAAIRPVADGEPGNAAVFSRPSENLRTRTEVVREELEALKFLSDADRALLLTGTGSLTWNGLPTGTFVLDPGTDLTLKPFMAPAVSTAPRLKICAGTVGQITIRGKQLGTVPTPRAYSGANNIRFTFVPVVLGTGAISITQSAIDPDFYTVTYDNHLTTGTTVDQLPGNSFLQQFNAHALMIAAGLEAVVEGGGTPPEVGFPAPPASVAGTLLSDPVNGIQPAEQATRYMSGAADAERHIITKGTIDSFWTADGGLNVLQEGDVVCVWYDELYDGGGGGRRESMLDLPENTANVPVGSLFLLRRFPERLPNAIPLATVVNGQLIFISGRVYGSGESGPLTASGSSYQGSAPNDWADGSTIAAGSFESAIDTIVSVLGENGVGTSGGTKIGNYPAGNIAATNVQAAINELDAEKFGLALNNTSTGTNTFTSGVANSAAIIATGNGNKEGVRSTGGATADGVYAKGGASGARGVYGVGTTGFAGVQGDGGPSAGAGVYGSAGINGYGVWGAGDGAGRGVFGEGAPGSATTTNTAPSTGNPLVNAAGVVGLGSSADGWGVVGKGNGGDAGGVAGIGIGGAGPGVLGVVEGDAPPTTNSEGVVGQSASGGVLGIGLANGYGVKGEGAGTGAGGTFAAGAGGNATGVVGQGEGAGNGVWGSSGTTAASIGVHGYTRAEGGFGVLGDGDSGGLTDFTGVKGTGQGAGVGVRAAHSGSGVGLNATSATGSAITASTGGNNTVIVATGSGTGTGVEGRTGTTASGANGVYGLCRADGGFGVTGDAANGGGTVTNGVGVRGLGKGTSAGVQGVAGTNGIGGDFTGNGSGVGVKVHSQNRWDLTNTDGDIVLVGGGSDAHKLKIGMATGGGGAGSASIAVHTTTGLNSLALGAGTTSADQSTLVLTGGVPYVREPPRYLATKTGVLHIPAAEWQADDSAGWGRPLLYGDIDNGNGPIYWNTPATGVYYLVAPIHLPRNGVITALDVFVRNYTGVTYSFRVEATQSMPVAGYPYQSQSVTFSGGNDITIPVGYYDWISGGTIFAPANTPLGYSNTDFNTRFYQAAVRWNQNGGNNLLFFGMRVTYTYTYLDFMI